MKRFLKGWAIGLLRATLAFAAIAIVVGWVITIAALANMEYKGYAMTVFLIPLFIGLSFAWGDYD